MPKLPDGFKTLIAISGITALFEEIEVTPPELDANGVIDQTTMRNTRYRTNLGKKLVTFGPSSITVAYDPAVIGQMHNILGQNRYITITFPDGATLGFYAVVNKFTPDALKEGERPQATLELIPSNLSTAATPVEAAPVFATGTTATTTTTTLAP
jgi:hypothetical protein